MELKQENYDKILQLLNKGVKIPNPLSIDIGEEVDIERISGTGVKIYPGSRIYGAKTVICPEAKIGAEAPATIDDCQVGPKVELKGGYFGRAVFLEKANMGSGSQVREGCILEEEAGGAHCVGIKQTILFPFVTLGSLINFCDCLMSGGISRKNHSEVGSSYIHFNFTPDGNKSTASLIGDVPRGVMLNQPAIFLGGQGGIVGPVRLGYGNVVAAGSILRNDCLEDNQLIIAGSHRGSVKNFTPNLYKNLARIISNNIIYLGNLLALEEWYKNIRKSFFTGREFGNLMYEGLMEKMILAKKERINRLKAIVEKVPDDTGERKELKDNIEKICELFTVNSHKAGIEKQRDVFLDSFNNFTKDKTKDYVKIIQSLPPSISRQGTSWLQGIIDTVFSHASSMLKLLNKK